MNKIFKVLVVFALACLLATFAVGFVVSLGDVRDATDAATQSWASLHRLAGIATCVIVMLVASVVVTYFIGTSRWCKEVCDTYSLDPRWIDESQQLKRRAFPWAVLSMGTSVVIAACGGAADPSATTRLASPGGLSWSQWHLLAASIGIGVILWGYSRQWQCVLINQEIIQRVMNEVRRIRQERGLDVEEPT